ncbi:angiotensin-converting enzyme-like isoform X2 [Dermacentor albipictus]|uniref:angiotensin-converting enzyme-like isoform X2 n=1 Tax=Dermacentor albipictus TaxID=60249 RepID=UPI0031FCDE56
MAPSWCFLLWLHFTLDAMPVAHGHLWGAPNIIFEEARGRMFAGYVNSILTSAMNRAGLAEWNYVTNITEYNKHKKVAESIALRKLHKKISEHAAQFRWTEFRDPMTRRIFDELSSLGASVLSHEKEDELTKLISEMQGHHASAKVCPWLKNTSQQCHLSLDPEIINIMRTSRNYCELLHVWDEWRKVAGKPMKEKFLRYVQLENEAAILGGQHDASVSWLGAYDDDNFERKLEQIWAQIKPLYMHLHAYVRSKLRNVYGNDRISEFGPIPAHLLGHIHAQHWTGITEITTPYPNKPAMNVTDTMLQMNMTVHGIFLYAEEFFTSMGLPAMPSTFWRRSLLEKPLDRKVVCHPSAWDFYINNDVRIKQCTQVNMDDFLTAHHEMGHVEYYLKYANQHIVFRKGANFGFHEAIGDTISLSVSTPKHLKAVGLLKEMREDYETDINYLFSVAVDKIALIPSAYAYDMWRWNVFRGVYAPHQYNAAWWTLLLHYQGICPAIRRSPDDFDPPSKYHISADVPYIRYFVSTVLQFQFYKALCDEANHVGPLHQCDFYHSKEAGKLFGHVMQLGSSKPWPEVLAILTRGKARDLDAAPLLEYFRPLYRWLQARNRGQFIGWISWDPLSCPGVTTCPVRNWYDYNNPWAAGK